MHSTVIDPTIWTDKNICKKLHMLCKCWLVYSMEWDNLNFAFTFIRFSFFFICLGLAFQFLFFFLGEGIEMPFYRILRMGCGVSKIDANGVATPNRSILPNFPTRKKQSTKFIPPKKEPMLLMPENDDRPSISVLKCDVNNLNCVNPEASKEENDEKRVAKIKTMVEEAEKNDERGRLHEDEGEGAEEEDGNDDDQRAINKVRVGEEDGNDFPSSPSFRVYFTDKDVETKKKDDGMCININYLRNKR